MNNHKEEEDSKPVSQVMVLGWAVTVLQTLMLAAGAWNIRETIRNGLDLSALKTEFAMRVEVANGMNAQHATFVTRSELEGQLNVIKDLISQLTGTARDHDKTIREIRERQISVMEKLGINGR